MLTSGLLLCCNITRKRHQLACRTGGAQVQMGMHPNSILTIAEILIHSPKDPILSDPVGDV